MRIVILGVGNILLSDEGIGVRAIEAFRDAYRLPPEVDLIDGGTTGMEMLEDLANATHLIIVDAVRCGQPPGTMVRIADEDVPVFFKTKLSPHQIGLSDVLATLALSGEEPGSVTVLGVQPVSLETGMSLSPPVEALLPALTARLAGELGRLGIVVEPAMREAA
ncbi:HyaD/HybD family hydrogenase maturation endopeptidase [Noviherbaspirillum denitrificans]|uniref:Hydrogenase 2 maturation endopeptidase n=1 Tax=Noviherbaspirillum denitrificans TaxID=1968433 RepID=A0A254TGA9_9BURK|nr:HyaD/HybD family hydrogenase maturation endopeptidase [Noviherbaspirillum denitrificans]OWW18708.1 hydrogenase 2 maturation endopeptidase [Noviherbaspirillum denitrificans]